LFVFIVALLQQLIDGVDILMHAEQAQK